MNRELVSNMFLAEIMFLFHFLSLAHRTTQTPAASSSPTGC